MNIVDIVNVVDNPPVNFVNSGPKQAPDRDPYEGPILAFVGEVLRLLG